MKQFMKPFLLIIILLSTFSVSVQAQNEVILNYESLYDVVPNINNCQEGILSQAEKMKVLATVNHIRSIHGLSPVVYDESYDVKTQKSALISAANEMLSHTPTTNFKCYSADGRIGAEHTNLHIQWFTGSDLPTSEYAVNSWMIDSNVASVGHRRWIIDPFLKFIAFGRVDGKSSQNQIFNIMAASIYVISEDKQDVSNWDNDFVAYPYQNYPSNLIFDKQNRKWHFSFTAIFDKINYWNNQSVDFSNATLEIRDDNNNLIASNIVSRNNEGYGVPNCLIFAMPTVQKESRYNVSIKNVRFNNQTKDFDYWFNITDSPVGTKPDITLLEYPENGSTEIPKDVTLKWNPADNADTYHIEIAQNSTFTNNLKFYSEIYDTQLAVSGLKESTTYYWRVMANNNAGNGGYSDVWSFTTESALPEKVVTISPTAGEIDVALSTPIIWLTVGNPDTYHLQIAKSNDFSPNSIIIDIDNLTDNIYNPRGDYLPENTTVYYRVAAENSKGKGDFSDVINFTTSTNTSVATFLIGASLTNYPNPFSTRTTVKLELNLSETISLEVFSPNGYKLLEIFNGFLQNGEHEFDFDMSAYSSGNYFIVLSGSNRKEILPVTLTK